ncbi:hypothetical protein LAV84_27175 [Rhizobium sp. VS19-DR104.2]|uniref:hypothetical protein n=1 Tax=unclassified Rhizobium TaxID=2613769 RepID=UPI001C5BEF9B|nr:MULTISPECIES: hypothetical protein [unclassified Rhizobium]MBZ5763235.1 hypothetical protein [Rhizobium sp. VS19-DR96]MBZ5769167.1 hypothetical protein [Rhizobium sp. VS19-DR129.2]MBZ5776705.1 hypothetical protein [Rhizobium sp. VS19-DRK62.2]MBZ5787822.1 hypothetical protein [Rhizobium sp. VS19-DR121]MBZ5805217.1 hypothetical protein [Rhizobium sp. VS19-DR181]
MRDNISSDLPAVEHHLSSPDASQLLADLVDVLLPGDEVWPSASSLGVHGVLAMRISENLFRDGLHELTAAIAAAGGPLAGHRHQARIAIVETFFRQQPRLFDWIYTASVLAYYEQPTVVAAIQATGRPYSIRPHVTGYPLAPFDMSSDRPEHGRGFFLTTESVRPLDISQLRLEENKTRQWGVLR